MSQAATLRALDADMFAAFADAGMADSDEVTYQGPNSATLVPCTVLFDQPEITRMERDGPSTGTLTEITLLRAEVPSPERGGRVTINATAFRLDELTHEDAGHTRWTVVIDRP